MEISLSGLSKKQKRRTALRFLLPGVPFRGEEAEELSGRLLERLKKRNTGLIGKINKKMRERKRKRALENEPDVATVSLPTENVAINTPVSSSIPVDNSAAPEGAPEGAVAQLTPDTQKAKTQKMLMIGGGIAVAAFVAYKMSKKKKRR